MKSCFSLFKPYFICIVLYILIVIAYGFYSYNSNKIDTLTAIDEKLALVASGVKRLLTVDFHDRAKDENSISSRESRENTLALTNYANTTHVLRVYTLIKQGRTLYYSSSSQPEAEFVDGLETLYFLSYDEASPKVFSAFDKMDATYFSESNKWGACRTVLIPEVSPGGHHYLAGADIDTRQVDEKLKVHLWSSLGISSFFILLAVPFLFLFRKTEKEHVEEFESLKDMLHQRSMDRTTRIERKINEFINKK
jgi:hypothetical protein